MLNEMGGCIGGAFFMDNSAAIRKIAGCKPLFPGGGLDAATHFR
jgi:hypothetical protein